MWSDLESRLSKGQVWYGILFVCKLAWPHDQGYVIIDWEQAHIVLNPSSADENVLLDVPATMICHAVSIISKAVGPNDFAWTCRVP